MPKWGHPLVHLRWSPFNDRMKTIDALKLLPVWVEPSHLVSTAQILMRGHGMKSLAVCDAGKLVGTVTAEDLAALEGHATVNDAMVPPMLVIQSGTSIRRVAEQFLEDGVDFAPVERDGTFLGIATSTMLLRELSRSWDPLTNLSWQDLLREWGVDNLKRGREVTVIFIDLDDFGLYNKRYGHTVGDQVLRKVAAMLGECVDSEKEVLVRYGGDEFAIGTVRERQEAEMLSEMIKRRVRDVFVSESEEPVTFCVGVYGGHRTKERENDHYQSTLDNLINLASKDCLAQKKLKDSQSKLTAEPSEAKALGSMRSAKLRIDGPKLVDVLADEHSPNSMTTVILSIGDGIVSGVSARMGGSALESVASATGKAVERAFPGTQFRVEEIHLAETDGRKIATVTAQVSDTSGSRPASGAVNVADDLYFSVAEATLEAFINGA